MYPPQHCDSINVHLYTDDTVLYTWKHSRPTCFKHSENLSPSLPHSAHLHFLQALHSKSIPAPVL